MKLTLKLGDIIHIYQTLKTIIDDADTKADALFKFKLLGMMKSLESHVANFEILRDEKIREYGTETEDGKISISEKDTEQIKKLNEDLSPIIDSEVEIHITPLQAKEIFDNGVRAEYLVGLYPVIRE